MTNTHVVFLTIVTTQTWQKQSSTAAACLPHTHTYIHFYTHTHTHIYTSTHTQYIHKQDAWMNIQVDLQLQAHTCSIKQLFFYLPTGKTVQRVFARKRSRALVGASTDI